MTAVADGVVLDAADADSVGAWRCVTDRVMGGVSTAALARESCAGRAALCLRARVSLANDGGFALMSRGLGEAAPLDASAFSGVQLTVCGDGGAYGCHLRTAACERPWQSYRLRFAAPESWTRLTLPFADAVPHRVAAPFDAAALRRIALAAIGEERSAALCVARVALV